MIKNDSHYLYKITNITKNKSYIGVTKNPKYRKVRHFSGFGNKGIAEDKNDNLIFEVLLVGSESYIYSMEKSAIKLYNTMYPLGYNKTLGGEAGPSCSGIKNPNAKLNEEDVFNIRIAYAYEGKTAVDLSELYKVSRQTIGTIVRGENWINAGGPICKNKIKRVTGEEKIQIKRLSKEGKNQNEIAKLLNRSVATILLHLD